MRKHKIFITQMMSAILLTIIALLPSQTVHAKEYPSDGKVITIPESLFSAASNNKEGPDILLPLSEQAVTLEGLMDGTETFYTVSTESMTGKSKLYLHLTYSDLLLDGSSVTVLIDDKAVFSKSLTGKKTEEKLTIPLNGSALSKGYHSLKVKFYGHILKEICVNEDNPANWLTIEGDSHLLLNKEPFTKRSKLLQDYPYPFIQPLDDNPVQGKIVIPDDSSTAILSASLQLAHYLSSETPESANIPILTESELKKADSHLIAIGTPDKWHGIIKDLAQSASLNITNNSILLQNNYIKAGKNIKQILFVTALKDRIIQDKIDLITIPEMFAQLTGDKAAIEQLPKVQNNTLSAKHSFKELEIPDITLTGSQSTSQRFFYNLPSYINLGEDASLHMQIKASKTLLATPEKDDKGITTDSELTVYINDEPHSIALDTLDKGNEDTYNVTIPITTETLKKAPYVTLGFSAHGLNQQAFCIPPNPDKWVFIKDTSYIELGIQKQSNMRNFLTWPAPFLSQNGLKDTLFLLPDESITDIAEQLQYITNSFGSNTATHDLQLQFEKDAEEHDLKTHHVIVLGGIDQHKSLQKKSSQLLVKHEKNGLDLSPYGFINETAAYTAWIQPSVWNPNKGMAVFAGLQKNDAFVDKRLIDYLKESKIHSNIIAENKAGEIFANDDQTKEGQSNTVADKSPQEKAAPGNKWLLAGFIGVIIIGLIIFIYSYRKKKKD